MRDVRLLVTRRLPQAVERRLAQTCAATFNTSDQPMSREALEQALTEYDIVLPTITDRFDAELFGSVPVRTRLIANFGAGTEHIDLGAARTAGIAVTNTPDALTEATAELAVTLMLMTARRAGEGERELRAGRWPGWHPTHLLGRSLWGSTLGLVGFGRIAQATARRAAALGMRIAYHSRTRAAAEVEAAFAATYCADLDALAAQSDIVSLHVPGGDATRHLVNARFLGAMKRDAILVNTARGSIVDEAALADALGQGRLAAAGLDVFEREPQVDTRLLTLENVVLLPHLGSATIETRTAMGMQAADNIDAFLAGSALPNRVV
ncbi:MAG: D-glycerate dehydrogenase [Sphingomonadales bacterium]|nr:D-glycerate dehydrogenase [Sphingomonadales bacterium]